MWKPQAASGALYKTVATDYCGGKAVIACSADDCGAPTWTGAAWMLYTGVYWNNTPAGGVWRGWFINATYVICST